MNRKFMICLILFMAQIGYSDTLTSLTCEYRSNPFGIDVTAPRLGWVFHSPVNGQKQTAYQIMVGSSSANADIGDVWNSGKITSSQSVHVVYAGNTLLSGRRYFWKVRVWDKDGTPSNWSEKAVWCMGKLTPSDWKGAWIGSGQEMVSVNLRKEITCAKTIKYATAFMSGLGYSELYIQGKKVGPAVLGPGFTTYTKRTYYVVEDVTSYLKTGTNAIGVMLGNGFYCTPPGGYVNWSTYPWRDAPKLLLDIEIEYEDGTTQSLSSDLSWKWSSNEITYNSLWDGEKIDARLAKNGWDSAGYNDASWSSVVPEEAPAGKLCARPEAPVIVTPSAPVSVAGNSFTFDALGLGWIRIKTSGISGQRLTVSGAFPNEIILAGGGEEEHAARFCFGAVEKTVTVNGLTSAATVTREATHLSMKSIGSFSSSSPFLNNLFVVDRRAIVNYLLDFPIDGTREKDGWTENAQNMMETVLYHFDALPAYHKWWQDMKDCQYGDGGMPEIAPGPVDYETVGAWNSPWWGGMIVWIPWKLYEFTGDVRFLEEGYDAMKAYVDYLNVNAGSDHRVSGFGLGDWGGSCPGDVNSMGFYSHAKSLSKAAALLGKTADAEHYSALTTAIGATFGEVDYGNPLALCLGIVPENKRLAGQQALVANVHNHDDHVFTGFVATPFFLQSLIEADQAELLYKVVTQPTAPSWSSIIRSDGVFGEFWDGGGNPMPGAAGCVGLYLYQGLGGIRPDSTEPGFKKIIISPLISPPLSYVNCSYETPYGLVVSNWTLTGDQVTMDITVPCNATASVRVPADSVNAVKESGKSPVTVSGVVFDKFENNRAIYTVSAGTYHFTSTRNFLRKLDSTLIWNGIDSVATVKYDLGDSSWNMNYKLIPRAQLTASATSQHLQGQASAAIDGNISTLWHTNFPGVSLPQSITLTLAEQHAIDGFVYYPRQDGSQNGEVTKYQISVSLDNITFTPVANGEWFAFKQVRMAKFPRVTAKYVKMDVLEGFGGFGSAAEIGLGYLETMTTSIKTTVNSHEAWELNVAPNPFNPMLNIQTLGSGIGTELKVFDVTGRLAANLTSELRRGSQVSKAPVISWNASKNSSGVYIVMLKDEKREIKRKVMLVR
ncbi:MAG: alpha-L-rhamnosidase N-terminal domain-containing protein [Fibrobacteres bacterium]|nr:alpha-L-rhamnosidase N-terminal domain-containing protein [Fibrobacterota bacterium]